MYIRDIATHSGNFGPEDIELLHFKTSKKTKMGQKFRF